jgi:hypothetical protein
MDNFKLLKFRRSEPLGLSDSPKGVGILYTMVPFT